jgi:methionyl aminopeptidase
MPIRLKKPAEIEKMRDAGRLVRLVLDRLGEMVAPGVTTLDLDAEAERLCRESGAECLFLGVPGRGKAGPFPASICSSVNEELVHGIPSKRAVRDGDILSIDFGVRLDGWCGDAAETFCVGQVEAGTRHLLEVTRNALAMAIAMTRPGMKWSSVARSMQEYVEGEGFSVVREFVGHGIGRSMWEEPKVPNFASPELESRDIDLVEGLVIAVEPMVNMGSADVKYGPDGWVVLTKDGRPSAHFEHMLAVTADGVSVLTDGS